MLSLYVLTQVVLSTQTGSENTVGSAVGLAVGAVVGTAVGNAVGAVVGAAVGYAVGMALHTVRPVWPLVHVPEAQSSHTE